MHKSKFAYAMLALSVAHDIRTSIRARKAAHSYLAAHEAFEEENRILQAKLELACKKLDQNNIPVTEFELIMLNNGLV